LDFVTHRPDMPLTPGIDDKVGLGLWNSIVGTFVVEGGLWALAVITYVRATQSTAGAGLYSLWLLTGALTLWFIVTPFAPQPAGDFTNVGVTIFLAVHTSFISLAYGIDRYRVLRALGSSQVADMSPGPPVVVANSGRSRTFR
jgi:hypothetical protein